MTSEDNARVIRSQRALASLLDALERGKIHLEDLSAEQVARLRLLLERPGETR
jgi:hypothetical protein